MKNVKIKMKYVILLILLYFYNVLLYEITQDIFEFLKLSAISIIIFSLCYFLFLLFKIKVIFKYLYRYVRSYIPIALVAVLSLLIAYIIYNCFNTSTPITQGEAMTFYGEYITFIGAFSLGYFLYMRDKRQMIEAKKNRCKLLLSCIQKATDDMMRISRFQYKNDNIIYDSNWREYYLEFESLTKGQYARIKDTLDDFFSTIDMMNLLLSKDDYKRAVEIYNAHVQKNIYSIRKYSLFEVRIILYNASYINELSYAKSYEPWDEKNEVKKLINECTDNYFGIVELYIYNYMIKNKITALENTLEFTIQIVDWLSTNSYIQENIISLDQKRIVSQIIFNISLQFKKKSEKLYFGWGQYGFK